jgi:hypothetical protein
VADQLYKARKALQAEEDMMVPLKVLTNQRLMKWWALLGFSGILRGMLDLARNL